MSNPFARFKQFYQARTIDNAFRLDGAVPLSKAIPFGVQHALAMFVGNIAPIIICFGLIAASREEATLEVTSNAMRSAIFMAAIGTILQLFPIWRFGSRTPLVVGSSFTFLGVLSMIGVTYGLGTMFLSAIIGGLLIALLGLFANKWRRFIKPIVSALVVLSIGLSLLGVGAKDFIGYNIAGVVHDGYYDFTIAWPYLIVGFATLITSLLWQIFVKGVWKNVSILVGMAVGYLVALCFIPYNGMVDFSAFRFESVTDFINVPRPYFTLIGASGNDFRFGAILTVIIIYLVTATESIGALSSLTQSAFGREPTDKEVSGTVSSIGLLGAFSGFFGCMPLTTYGQNVGIVSQTKITNRFCMLQGALLLLIAAFFTPITTFFLTIPGPVLGGITLTLFASIAIIGMEMFASLGFTPKNVMIASLALGLGYGITLIPEFTAYPAENDAVKCIMLILANPVANTFIISLILSYLIPDSLGKPKADKNPQ